MLFQKVPVADVHRYRNLHLEEMQRIRTLLWRASAQDPAGVAIALTRLLGREAKLLGLDSPTKVALDGEGQLTLAMVRTLLARKAESEAILERQQLETTTAEEVDESATDENNDQSGAAPLTLEALRRAGNGSGPADDGERG